MQLTIQGEFAKELLSRTKDNTRLARTLAEQWLDQVEPQAMAGYLLTEQTAITLLIERLQQSPGRTFEELAALPLKGNTAGSRQRAAKPAKKAARKKTAVNETAKAAQKPTAQKTAGKKTSAKKTSAKKASAKKASAKQAAKGPGKRTRLNAAQIADLKGAVRHYLSQQKTATRRQIIDSAEVPTESIYNRLMGELRDGGEVVQRGMRAKAVYSLTSKGRKRA